jgi:hypothetical protein
MAQLVFINTIEAMQLQSGGLRSPGASLGRAGR